MQINTIKLIECPRDAMQGIHTFIPTELKIDYLNTLLQVGFDTLDFGSFVSPKAIPQMADTADVLAGLNLSETKTKLLAIIANLRGAESAVQHQAINYLGYPFSVSPTFQQRNANTSPEAALQTVAQIQDLCLANNKKLVVYLSMAFGNPYGDTWNYEIVENYAAEMAALGVPIISLADTIGTAAPEDVSVLFERLIPKYPQVEFGAHFHAVPHKWQEKIIAAQKADCTRFDGALKGFGGCPFAKDELVGNIATENLIAHFGAALADIQQDRLQTALEKANYIFHTYH